MLCGIDPDQCANSGGYGNIIPALGVLLAAGVVVVVLYPLREVIGGLLAILFGVGVIVAVGLFQTLFLLSFVPAVIFFTIVPSEGTWRRWRHWHPATLLAAPILAAGAAVAMFGEVEKTTIIAINAVATAILVYGVVKTLASGTVDDDGSDKKPGADRRG